MNEIGYIQWVLGLVSVRIGEIPRVEEVLDGVPPHVFDENLDAEVVSLLVADEVKDRQKRDGKVIRLGDLDIGQESIELGVVRGQQMEVGRPIRRADLGRDLIDMGHRPLFSRLGQQVVEDDETFCRDTGLGRQRLVGHK